MSENHYEVLGVEPSATRDELRDAYRARVDELTAARERKGITPSQLEQNRDEVAKVRSAWNVLSDPFQRQRYDTQAESGAGEGVSGEESGGGGAGGEAEVQLTGWRRLMAPPPPKPGGGGGRNGTPPARPVRQPTIPLPPGMNIAQPRVRGMAFLFDLAIVLLLMFAVNSVVPNLIQSDYVDKTSQITSLSDATNAQSDIDDARSAVDDANDAVASAEDSGKQGELRAAQDDLKDAKRDLRNAQDDFAEAQKDFNEKQDSQDLPRTQLPHNEQKLDDLAEQLSDDIWATQIIVAVIILVVALLYLVPITLRTGSTFGMRSRKIKVVSVTGAPATLGPVVARFAVPLVTGLAGGMARVPLLAAILPVAALGMVLLGYRDANGQGVHDKLARTLVVEA